MPVSGVWLPGPIPQRTVHEMKSLVVFAATFLILDAALCQPVQESGQSAFVRRMLSLDRDKDGALSAAELPGTMKDLLRHDENSDGKLNAGELALAEKAAKSTRSSHAPGSAGSSRKGRRGRAKGANRRGGGSPLDPAQIIRFAKSFDTDSNGILSAAELKKYAIALAARKTRDRKESSAPESDQSSARQPPVGLEAPGGPDESNPFGNNAKQPRN